MDAGGRATPGAIAEDEGVFHGDVCSLTPSLSRRERDLLNGIRKNLVDGVLVTELTPWRLLCDTANPPADRVTPRTKTLAMRSRRGARQIVQQHLRGGGGEYQ